MDTTKIPHVLRSSPNVNLPPTCSSRVIIMSSVHVSTNFFFVTQKCCHCCKNKFATS
jgi:hypothetical protein